MGEGKREESGAPAATRGQQASGATRAGTPPKKRGALDAPPALLRAMGHGPRRSRAGRAAR
eukprot:4689375-Alexandrium_andersonii.AAC.1